MEKLKNDFNDLLEKHDYVQGVVVVVDKDGGLQVIASTFTPLYASHILLSSSNRILADEINKETLKERDRSSLKEQIKTSLEVVK